MEAQSCLVLLLETTVTILEIQNFTFVCFFGWQGWKLILKKKLAFIYLLKITTDLLWFASPAEIHLISYC